MSTSTGAISPFLPNSIDYPKDPEQMRLRLQKAYKDTAYRLNDKEIALYYLQELATGQSWFSLLASFKRSLIS